MSCENGVTVFFSLFFLSHAMFEVFMLFVHRLKVNCEWQHFILMHTHIQIERKSSPCYLNRTRGRVNVTLTIYVCLMILLVHPNHEYTTPTYWMEATHANLRNITATPHHLNDLFKRDFSPRSRFSSFSLCVKWMCELALCSLLVCFIFFSLLVLLLFLFFFFRYISLGYIFCCCIKYGCRREILFIHL